MSTLKYFSILFFVVFSGYACQKDALSYDIEGIITDLNTKDVISGLTVKIYQKEYKSGVLTNSYTYLGETVTDSEGRYSFNIERSKIYEIKLEIDDPNYYFYEVGYGSSLLTTEGTNVFNEKIESRSWLAVILENPFVGPDEQLNINKTKFKEDCEACCSNGTVSFIETGDTTFVCATVGGADVILNYGVVGSNNQFSKTISCIPFDTTFFTISY
jgi:hypothetical protein